jgi:Tol biopolymer transport system component
MEISVEGGIRGGPAVQLNDKLWQRPTISRDGTLIAGFYADHELNWQEEPTNIAVMGTDPGQPWKIIPIPPSVSITAGIRWSLDGQELTYVDNGKDGDNIWSQPLKGGPPRQVTQLRGHALFGFDWSPDSKQLVFSRGIQSRDLILIRDLR